MNRLLTTSLPAAPAGTLLPSVLSSTLLSVLLSASLLLAPGCANKVVRTAVQPDDIIDINFASGALSSLAGQMIDGMLAFTPIVQVTAQRRPVIFVYRIRNNSGEQIDTDPIIEAIRTKISGVDKFTFVDATAVTPVQEQLGRQMETGRMDPKTAVRLGQQIGAEYMLYGTVEPSAKTGSPDTNAAKPAEKVRGPHHVFALRLIHLPSGIIEWQQAQEIRNRKAR